MEEVKLVKLYKAYIEKFAKEKEPIITEIEQYAKENYIPIMEPDAIDAFLGLLTIQQPTAILEIGSAIGYSAIRMAKQLPKASIVTIEREPVRYQKALHYIEATRCTDRIEIVEADALGEEADVVLNKTYDALFIDAAKGQYRRFFDKYAPVIRRSGVIYCDNMFMHGMVLQEEEDVPKRKRTMIRRLQEFTTWLMRHPDYDTTLLPIGDGLLIAVKK